MLDRGIPALRMMTAWSSAMTDCAATSACLWWGAASQMSEAMAGPLTAVAATFAPPKPLVRSWYRAPDARSQAMAPYEMLARMLTPPPNTPAGAAWWPDASLSWLAGPAAAPWFPTALSAWSATPYGVHPKVWSDAAMMTLRNPFAAAWMEGASRAFLPPALAVASEIARRPSSGIPFVSYRSNGGHAVAQIAYATTSALIAAAPAVIAWLDAVAPTGAHAFSA